MITIEREVLAAKPRDRVFGYLADFETTTEWDPGTVRTVRVDGDGGVGTAYRNTSRFAGRETELTYVVEEREDPSRIVLRGENRTVLARDTMLFRETADGTAVTYRAEFRFKGLGRLLEPLFRRAFDRLGDAAEGGLREALAGL